MKYHPTLSNKAGVALRKSFTPLLINLPSVLKALKEFGRVN
jgi:hypothetical protein